MACDTIKIETLDADEVVSIVTQGPQGPSGAEAATLTTTGDLLYRAALANDRLPIGSEGQVLKVSSGLPAWGNESGAVTEVNGQTGAVVLDAADVGAAPIFSQINVEITDDYVVSPSRALILSVRNLHQNQANIRLPLASASVAGDVIVIANSSNSLYETLNVQYFFTGPSIWVTLNTINRGEQKRYILPTAGSWSLVSVDTHTHAASDITSGTLDIARIPTGTGSTQVALGNHTHTQLHDKSHTMTDATSHTAGNHKVFYSDGNGNVQELSLGNSGEVLTSNGATSAPSFAAKPVELVIACSDETSDLTTGTAKVTFRAPYAFTLTGVRASVNTAPTGSTLIVDINNGANSALSTKLSIDASEKTSTTAATAAVIDTSYDDISDDAEITIDIDQIGSTVAGKGLKVTLIGTRA